MCQKLKPLTQYSRNLSAKAGLRSNCKECQAKYDLARVHKRRESYTFRTYQKKQVDYDVQLVRQGGLCGICGCTEGDNNGYFHWDHCHVEGHIRGLLCSRCNTGLGSLGDSQIGVMAALDYLDAADEELEFLKDNNLPVPLHKDFRNQFDKNMKLM